MLNTKEFIRRSKKIHKKENLDYSKVVYVNNSTPVCIIDNDINPKTGKPYGEFWQKPKDHLLGKTNSAKKGVKRKTTSEFIEEAKASHPGENLDYSKVEYINANTPVCIIDHDINPRTGKEYGEYWQTPYNHSHGASHPLKGVNKSAKTRSYTKEEFIKMAKNAHPDENLDYSKFDYVDFNTKGIIIDHDINPETGKEYGEYWQKPSKHVIGQSHPGKTKLKITKKNSLSYEVVMKRLKKKFPNFDYSRLTPDNFTGYSGKAIFGCPVHGFFENTIQKFYESKFGCPKCAHNLVSYKEDKLYDYILTIIKKNDVIRGYRKLLPHGKEVDLYFPKKRVAIEFDGIFYHSDEFCRGNDYHILKTDSCEDREIHLIHIFEDEYYYHENLVKGLIKRELGIGVEKLPVSSISVKEITKEVSDEFLEMNDLNGKDKASIYMGAYYKDKLVAVILFKKTRNEGEYEMNRYAVLAQYTEQELIGSCLLYFARKYKVKSITAFVNRRWVYSKRNVFLSLGFATEKIYHIDFQYVKGRKRFPKSYLCKKNIEKQFPDYDCTGKKPKEIAEELGFHRIYDCGKIKYRLEVKK